ncbi:MAG: MarR family transcriptional regulator [Acidimicrobiales bacterium]|nr:MarR family transcriptional regulator [Acidimicrobiales bacterium]
MTGLNTTNGLNASMRPEVADHLDDPRLTAFGILHEVHFGALASVERDLEGFGFTLSTFEVLLRLSRSPQQRLRMSELTAQCTITSSGLTRVVDRMEAAGHVVREPCESDRRGFYAVLTPKGLDELVASLPTHLATLDRFWSVLDQDEMESLMASMRKLRAFVMPDSDPAAASGQ